jgi:hypothetical protein
MPADGVLTGTAGLARRARPTLAAEHVLLLDQVTARTAEVRTAAAGGAGRSAPVADAGHPPRGPLTGRGDGNRPLPTRCSRWSVKR